MRSAWLIAAIPLVMGIALAQDTNPTPAPAPAATTETQTAPANAAELKAYKGTLVDASCAFPGTAAGSTANTPANSQACPVSSSTTQFAVRLDDGHTVKVDAVGNVRAQDTIKNKKNWSEAASSGKPIHTKINGMLNGDTLTVVSMK